MAPPPDYDLAADAVVMCRPDLGGLDAPRAPDGYALRTFRPGDEDAWQTLYLAAYPESLDSIRTKAADLQASPVWRPERTFFICRDDRPVAVTLAWDPPWEAPGAGWVHWVAAHPDHRRRGLARAAITAALAWMRDDGRTAALLLTQVYRLPAIRLYLALGFEPMRDIRPGMAERWARVEADLRAAGAGGL